MWVAVICIYRNEFFIIGSKFLNFTYYQSGNIPAAIKNLEDLSNLIPSKFYPRYELVKLYYQSGDLLKCNQMARFILSMPVKKMSPEVNMIKKATRQLLFDATKVNEWNRWKFQSWLVRKNRRLQLSSSGCLQITWHEFIIPKYLLAKTNLFPRQNIWDYGQSKLKIVG